MDSAPDCLHAIRKRIVVRLTDLAVDRSCGGLVKLIGPGSCKRRLKGELGARIPALYLVGPLLKLL